MTLQNTQALALPKYHMCVWRNTFRSAAPTMGDGIGSDTAGGQIHPPLAPLRIGLNLKAFVARCREGGVGATTIGSEISTVNEEGLHPKKNGTC